MTCRIIKRMKRQNCKEKRKENAPFLSMCIAYGVCNDVRCCPFPTNLRTPNHNTQQHATTTTTTTQHIITTQQQHTTPQQQQQQQQNTTTTQSPRSFGHGRRRLTDRQAFSLGVIDMYSVCIVKHLLERGVVVIHILEEPVLGELWVGQRLCEGLDISLHEVVVLGLITCEEVGFVS